MSLDNLLKKGEQIYFEKYREKLEKEFLGSYIVIDIDTEQYALSENKKQAFELAKEKFGKEKLFFGTQIGSLNSSTVNFKENASLSWAV